MLLHVTNYANVCISKFHVLISWERSVCEIIMWNLTKVCLLLLERKISMQSLILFQLDAAIVWASIIIFYTKNLWRVCERTRCLEYLMKGRRRKEGSKKKVYRIRRGGDKNRLENPWESVEEGRKVCSKMRNKVNILSCSIKSSHFLNLLCEFDPLSLFWATNLAEEILFFSLSCS